MPRSQHQKESRAWPRSYTGSRELIAGRRNKYKEAKRFINQRRKQYATRHRIPDSPTNWNEGAFIICPWYGICIPVPEIQKDPDIFFVTYPLLDPSDKSSMAQIDTLNPPKGYLEYLSRMEKILDTPPKKSCEVPGLDMLCPRL